MSQVVECSRCHSKPAFTVCTMCEEMGDKIALCGECFTPHYRLMHNYDPSTGEKIEVVTLTEMKILPKSKATLVLKTPKGKGKIRKAVDKQVVQEWIRKNLK